MLRVIRANVVDIPLAGLSPGHADDSSSWRYASHAAPCSWYEGVVVATHHNVNKGVQEYLYDVQYSDGDVKRGVAGSQLHSGDLGAAWMIDKAPIHRLQKRYNKL